MDNIIVVVLNIFTVVKLTKIYGGISKERISWHNKSHNYVYSIIGQTLFCILCTYLEFKLFPSESFFNNYTLMVNRNSDTNKIRDLPQ